MRSQVFHIVAKIKERTFNKSFFQYNALVHYFGNESIMLIVCFDCDVGDQSEGWSKGAQAGAERPGVGSAQKPATALGILLPAAQILEQLWQKKIYYREKYPELFFQLKKELRRFSHNSKFAPAPKSAEGPVLWLRSMYLG